MSKRQYVVDVPLRQPNWFGSIFPLTSSTIHETTKSSKVFAKHDVKDMGLVSPSDSGDFTLSIGVILASFQIPGTVPLFRLVLKIVVIGVANSCANSFRTRHGMLSGPWAFEGLIESSFLQTSCG